MTAIFYKEWIKTRWYLLVALLSSIGFSGYCMLRLHRMVSVQGADHAWIVMMTHDQTFVDLLTFIPLICGILLGLFQFVPEMYHKCLKLTLHLPVGHLRLTASMLGYGMACMAVLTLADYVILLSYLPRVLAVELYGRVLLTAAPWALAGLAAYLLTAWVVLEPAWRRRLLNICISLLVLRVYFLSSVPMAYVPFLPWLAVFSLALALLSIISISRFKEGQE